MNNMSDKHWDTFTFICITWKSITLELVFWILYTGMLRKHMES